MPHDDLPADTRETGDERDPLDAMLRALPELTLDRRVRGCAGGSRRARAVLVAEADGGVVRSLRGVTGSGPSRRCS